VRLVVDVGHHWPLSSDLGRPRDGPALARSADGQHPRCALSEPQPTTASQEDGSAPLAGTRVPRCAAQPA
jgi:hypothetical protein